MHQKDFNVLSVHTTGAPRAGDATFAAFVQTHLGESVFRLARLVDLTPRVPPHRDSVDLIQNKIIFSPAALLGLPMFFAIATRAFFKKASYLHVGEGFDLHPNGAISPVSVIDGAWDVEFWGRKETPNKENFSGHVPGAYICDLAKNMDKFRRIQQQM